MNKYWTACYEWIISKDQNLFSRKTSPKRNLTFKKGVNPLQDPEKNILFFIVIGTTSPKTESAPKLWHKEWLGNTGLVWNYLFFFHIREKKDGVSITLLVYLLMHNATLDDVILNWIPTNWK